ncbi:MAG: hypothetical protein ACRYGL_20795 [Janthinobacterium lividum]
MSTRRKRPSGNWEDVVRRKDVLPKPLTFAFGTEAEGDAYVARLAQMIDTGNVPDELNAQRPTFIAIDGAIRAYLTSHLRVASEIALFGRLMDRWKKEPLTLVSHQWTEAWARSMKRVHSMAPSNDAYWCPDMARILIAETSWT